MSTPKVCPYCGGHVGAKLTECPSCHTPLRWAMDDALPEGTVLAGRYLIIRTLSQDGEGYFYAAKERSSELSVVIKEYFPLTLSAPRLQNGGIEAKMGREVPFKTLRMDFEELYTTLQQITPATGLTAVLDLVRENGTTYAVLEPARGQTLSQYLRGKRPLRPAEVRSILQPVMEGAAAMHKAGLIHRGISPETIFVTKDGAASLAGYATQGLRSTGSELKPQMYEGYMAPEQYSMAEFEGRYTDVYALAAVAYRMATGHVPVSARQRQTRDSLEPAEEFSSAIPSYFSDVLCSAMELQPGRRIQNVPELMGMLASQTTAHTMMTAGGKRQSKQKAQVSTRNVLMTASVIILVLVCLLGWCIIKLTDRQEKPVPAAPDPAASQVQTQQTALPSFVGKRLSAIQHEKEYLAYRFTITEEYSSEVANGVVIRQSPAAGSEAPQNGTVELVVSRGPQLATMPKIFGFTQEKAIEELDKAGIRYSLLMVANDGQYAAGTVARTEPAEGESFDPDTRIANIYIAAERDNTAALTIEEYQEQNQEQEQEPEPTQE